MYKFISKVQIKDCYIQSGNQRLIENSIKKSFHFKLKIIFYLFTEHFLIKFDIMNFK